MLPVWSSFGFDDKARLSTTAVLVAATVWIYAGTFVVGCKAFVVTLVHRIFESSTTRRAQGGNIRGDEEAGKREEKQATTQ